MTDLDKAIEVVELHWRIQMRAGENTGWPEYWDKAEVCEAILSDLRALKEGNPTNES